MDKDKVEKILTFISMLPYDVQRREKERISFQWLLDKYPAMTNLLYGRFDRFMDFKKWIQSLQGGGEFIIQRTKPLLDV